MELVTGFDTVAPFAAETLEDVLTRARLHAAGVAMRTATVVTAIAPGRVQAADEFGGPLELAADGVVLVTQRISRDRLFHELDGSLPRVYRIGDCVAPRLLAESIFDGHRLAREIDSGDPEVALPYLRERPLDEPPAAPAAGPPAVELLPRVQPRTRSVQLVDGSAAEIAERIDRLVDGSGSVVVAAGRGAGSDLEPYRALARRYGGSFAVSRPQVEAGRATRADLVGASSNTVAPDVYLAFGISGAIPHLVGMAESRMVIAVNSDRGARIFDHADVGAVAEAGEVIRSFPQQAPFRVTQ